MKVLPSVALKDRGWGGAMVAPKDLMSAGMSVDVLDVKRVGAKAAMLVDLKADEKADLLVAWRAELMVTRWVDQMVLKRATMSAGK